MHTPHRVREALMVLAGVIAAALVATAAASDPGQAAADQVSLASYRNFLDNKMYAHAGDNRGYGPEHDKARDNIEALLKSYGLDVVLEPFPYQSATYYNVVATQLGTVYPDKQYLVGGHYDSVNNPGADDNGSGVSLVLETARILSQYDSDYTIIYIAFDREEQGLIGSKAYVNRHLGDDILGMFSTDMVAYNTGANLADILGRSASRPLTLDLAEAVTLYGQGLRYNLGGSSSGSDHAPFENAGYQACLFIEDWGNPYYHTQQDNVDMPNYIDYAFAVRLTRSVVGFLVDHAQVNVPYDGLSFVFPNGQPERVIPDGGWRMRVEVLGVGSEVPKPGTGRFHYDTGSGWQSTPMQVVSPNVYDAVFPAADCGGELRYYVSAESMTSKTYTDPRDAPSTAYVAAVSYGRIELFHDNFQTNKGWTAENLGASSGDWERGVPVNDPQWQYDPIKDSDGSGKCWLTENRLGNSDVDDGAVRLKSPSFDLSGGGVVIGYDYYLYLTNTTGGVDRFLVEISSNGSAGPWIEIARHTTSGGLDWRHHEVDQEALNAAGVTMTADMRLRFTTNDANPQSINESGLDAFDISKLLCTCLGDLDGDGIVSAQDLTLLLAAWMSTPGDPNWLDRADLDGDNIIGAPDLTLLLAGWGPCP